MAIHKQVPIVVAVIKDSEGNILIAKRNDPNLIEAHGKWELVGGKVEFGEDPEDAIIREVREETGLEVKVLKLLPKLHTRIWNKAGEQHQVFLCAYECEIIGGDLHDEEFDPGISALQFIKPEQLDRFEFIGPKEIEIIKLTLNF